MMTGRQSSLHTPAEAGGGCKHPSKPTKPHINERALDRRIAAQPIELVQRFAKAFAPHLSKAVGGSRSSVTARLYLQRKGRRPKPTLLARSQQSGRLQLPVFAYTQGTLFMASIKEEDFLFKSDIEIVHRPTGANISTYRYPDPADACSTITVSFGPDDSEYDRMDIVRAAYELLRQKARGA